jgi:hypothetical protein
VLATKAEETIKVVSNVMEVYLLSNPILTQVVYSALGAAISDYPYECRRGF